MSKKGYKPSEKRNQKISLALTGHSVSKETRQKISDAHKGKKHTEEQKYRISLGNMGKKHSEETKHKLSLIKKGRKLSEETKQRISLAKKGRPSPRKGTKCSEESKRKMSLSHKGQIAWNKSIPCREETKKKLSLSHIGLVSGNKGKGGWHHTDEQRKLMSQRRTGILLSEETKHKISLMHKGKKLTDEHKRKIGLTSLGRTWQMTDEQKEICRLNNMGEKNPNWQGGISFEPYDKNFNCCLKKQIAERDLYTCQICGEILPKGFAIHHIDYNKKNSNSSNLVFLCKHCHVKKTNYNRRYWIQYFTIKQNNIKVKYELQDKFDEQKGALKKWL